MRDDQLAIILDLTNKAPSGDNCQPWRFVWDHRELRIFHVSSRAQHALNPNNICSYLALGALLENLTIAAAEFGYGASINLNANLDEVLGCARVTFSQDAVKDGLFAAISMRRTDRGRYAGGELNEPLARRIVEDLAKVKKYADIHFCPGVSEEAVALISQIESLIFQHRHLHSDLMRWIRFFRGALAGRDGMTLRDLGLAPWEWLPFTFCRFFTVQKIFNRFGFLKLLKRTIAGNLRSSAGMFCITINENHPDALIEAGRLAERAWLRLNANGYAVQPHTLPAMATYLQSSQQRPLISDGRYANLATRSREFFRAEFNIPDKKSPVWLFRYGRASASKSKNQIKRRLKLKEIFIIE